jgi:hypothetical protein
MTKAYDRACAPEIQALLHPSQAYAHPRDVLNDPDLTTYEKRAILSAWASDACAVESCPSIRRLPGAKAPVTFDDVLDALKSLDDDEPPPRPGGKSMRLGYRRDGPEPDSGGSAIM